MRSVSQFDRQRTLTFGFPLLTIDEHMGVTWLDAHDQGTEVRRALASTIGNAG